MINMKLCQLQLALCKGTKSSRQHKKLFLAPLRGAGRLKQSSFLVYILNLKPAAEASNEHESAADLLDHFSAESVELFLFSTLHSAAEAAVRNQANVLKHSRAPWDGHIPVGHYYLMFYTSVTDGDCIENCVCVKDIYKGIKALLSL